MADRANLSIKAVRDASRLLLGRRNVAGANVGIRALRDLLVAAIRMRHEYLRGKLAKEGERAARRKMPTKAKPN